MNENNDQQELERINQNNNVINYKTNLIINII
jgi:hypothetical protein